MIQALNLTNFDAYMNTEANRINVSVASTHIRHLVKFINDFTGDVFYVYPDEVINSRFDFQAYAYAAVPDRFAAEVKLAPTGYFKYEVYEVSWIDITPPGDAEALWPLQLGYAPVTETDVLPVDDLNGVVEGLVAIGKLYLKPSERKVPEVTYRQYVKRVQTIEIIEPGKGYTSPPTIAISAPEELGGITATATCTLSGTSVNSVTITYAGSCYTETPTVTVSAPPPGGGALQCLMIATIEEQNYIYSN